MTLKTTRRHQPSNRRGTLAVVATPIGNLDDLSPRAVETLRQADVIACEDTRVTKKLLDRHGLDRPLMSVHQHSGAPRVEAVVRLLQEGQCVALVTDAGTPGISDPGGVLVTAAYDRGAQVIAIPGPSALAAALSVSGVPTDQFHFLGFPPHKKGRSTLFQQIAAATETVAFYESPYRVMDALERLRQLLSDNRMVVVCRELTKMYEEVVRGSAKYVYDVFTDNPGKVRGEFVVVVGPGTSR